MGSKKTNSGETTKPKSGQAKASSSKSNTKNQGWSNPLWISLALGLLSFLLYVNTFHNDFVLDDTSAVSLNNFVKSGFKGIGKILTTEYRAGFWGVNGNLYRPLPLVVFAVLWQYFPGQVMPFHVVNSLMFAATIVLIFILFRKLLKNMPWVVAAGIALLFATHPIHTEVVANIKSLDEILSLGFALLGCLLILRYLERPSALTLPALFGSYFLALCSKEGAITMVLIFPLMMYFFTQATRAHYLKVMMVVGASALLYLSIRGYVLTHQTGHIYKLEVVDNSILAAQNLGEKTASCFVNLGKYLWMCFVPNPLSIDYTYNQIPVVGWSSPMALLALLAYLGLAFWVWMRREQKDAWAFGVLFYFITISLYSNLFYVIGVNFAERLLYIPSLGMMVALVVGLYLGAQWLSDRFSVKAAPRIMMAVVLIASLAGAVRTVARNAEWKNLLSLCRADIQSTPQSAHLNFWYGKELVIDMDERKVPEAQRKPIYDSAIACFTRALEIYPPFGDAYAYRGKVYARLNDIPKAEADYAQAAYRRVPMWEVYRDLGILHNSRHEVDSALFYFQRALQIDASQASVYQNMGYVYQKEKRYEEAIAGLMKAISIEPRQASYYEDIAINYHYMGNYDQAISFYNQALQRLTPDQGNIQREIYSNLYQAYRSKGDMPMAEKYKQ